MSEELGSWQAYFSRCIEAAKMRLCRRAAGRAGRTLLVDQDRAKLDEDMRRAARIRALLESDVWVKDLVPFIDEHASLKPTKRGMCQNLDQVAIDHLFDSGAAAFADALVKQIESWVSAGDDAHKKVERDDGVRKQVEEIVRGR